MVVSLVEKKRDHKSQKGWGKKMKVSSPCTTTKDRVCDKKADSGYRFGDTIGDTTVFQTMENDVQVRQRHSTNNGEARPIS